MKILRSRKSKEVGAASIIFVLLVSLAITASTTAVVQSIRNTQEIGLAVNAVTHAQTGLWTGTEAFRRYLQSIDESTIQALGSQDLDIVMDPSYGNVTAEDITSNPIVGIDNAHRVTAKIVNLHDVAKSSASHEVVFNVVGSAGGAADYIPAVHFNDSVSFDGGIELLNNGELVDLTVNGDVTFGGVGVNLINSVNATGNVTLNSSVAINSIYAEENVILNSSTIQTVETLGTLTTSGSATVQNVWANDDVIIGSSGHFENVNSVRNISVGGGGTQGTLTAGETITLTNTSMAASVNAVGNISTGHVSVGDIVGMGDVTCVSPTWTNVSSINVNGTANNCPPNGGGINVVENAANVVSPMAPLLPRPINAPTINVWDLKDDANYFVHYDSTANRMKVTVNHINGVVDGTVFTIGDLPHPSWGAPYNDYLCTSVSSSGECTAPTTPMFPLCFHNSVWNNNCISYNSGTNTFDLNPSKTAPGIMFFDGNLKVRGGKGATSFLASGDIEAGQSSSFEGWAANFGAYPKVCAANADHIGWGASDPSRIRYIDAFTVYYPTNLCDIANSTYTPIATGNISLASGGINPDLTVNPSGLYDGGNIDLESNVVITGLVLAGNYLNTSGDVTIKGLVSAGAYGNPADGDNKLGGSTTIDLNSATDDYNSVDTTLLSGGGNSSESTMVFTATMLWGRSL